MKTKNKNNYLSTYIMEGKSEVIVSGKKCPLSSLPLSTPLLYEAPNRTFALFNAIDDISKACNVPPSDISIKYHDMLRVIE